MFQIGTSFVKRYSIEIVSCLSQKLKGHFQVPQRFFSLKGLFWGTPCLRHTHMTAVIDYQPIIILNLLMGKVESPQITKIIVEMERRHLSYNKRICITDVMLNQSTGCSKITAMSNHWASGSSSSLITVAVALPVKHDKVEGFPVNSSAMVVKNYSITYGIVHPWINSFWYGNQWLWL